MFSPSVNKENMRSKKWVVKAVCFFALCAFSAPAFAQSDLYNRLKRAERDIETLSKAVYKSQKLPDDMLGAVDEDQKYRAQMDVRLSDLETQIRTLRGDIEKYQYNLDMLTSKVDALEMGARQAPAVPTSNVIPMGRDAVRNTITAPLTQGNNTAVKVEQQKTKNVLQASSPTNAYESAYSLLKNGNNKGAQEAFDAFIIQYGSDPLAHNARYWLGETFYVQGDYEPAARIFAEAYQKDPNGVKSADNLLKLGLSLSGLGRKDDACVSFGQLKKEFGATSSSIIHRGEQESTKFGCK